MPDLNQQIRALVADANNVAARTKAGETVTLDQIAQLRLLAQRLEKELKARNFVAFAATYYPTSGAITVDRVDAAKVRL